MARCDAFRLSGVLSSSGSSRARIEALNALSYLSDSNGEKIGPCVTEIILSVTEKGTTSDRERAMITGITSQVIDTGCEIDKPTVADGLIKIVIDSDLEDVQRAALHAISKIIDENFISSDGFYREIFELQTRTFDEIVLQTSAEILKKISSSEMNALEMMKFENLLLEWLNSVISGNDLVLSLACELLSNLTKTEILRNRALEIGLDEILSSFIDSPAPSRVQTKNLLNALSALELQKRRSNPSVPQSPRNISIRSPTMVEIEN